MNHIKEEILKTLLTKTGTLNSAILRRGWFKNSILYKKIQNEIPFTNNVGEQIYCILNDINKKPLCPTCKTPLKFKMFKYGYPKTCNKNKCIRENNNWSSCSKTTIKNNVKFKILVFDTFKNNKYILKDKKDVLSYINTKVKTTNKGKLGRFINSLNGIDMLCSILYYTKDIIPITEKYSWSERFYVLHNNIVKIPNCIECNKNSKYINFIKGYQKTCSLECGNKGYAQQCRINSHLNEILPKIKEQNITILSTPNNGLNSEKFKLQCNICNNVFDYKMNNGKWQNIYCNSCHSSRIQKEIKQFIVDNITTNLIENDRIILDGKEIDLYLPDYKFAIEVDGIYWHSELTGKKRNYHINKTRLCEKKGIHLIHIFENEWIFKSDIIKSIILTKLKLNTNRIYARNTIIKEIDNKTKKVFLNTNHLQGNGKSKYKFGLFYNEDLVCVMTFGKRKITKNSPEYEIIRFATKLNINVIGGASKLLKHFEKTVSPIKLITYADRRYSNSNVFYEFLGFTFSHESKPNYWYFKNSLDLLSRVNFQKHKLKYKLNIFDETLSEWDNMKNNGYNRIWDCGNYVFKKQY